MNGKNRIQLEKKEEKATQPKRKFSKRTLISFLVVLVLFPVTIWAGWRYWDRNYYVVSLLLILYTMIPFFLAFEKRKPQAKELVMLAVMCGIAVAARTAFIWLPHFKPMAAIIIIAGVAFGAESGFLVGAVSALVSNFIFGQGAWTPWQMFAFGMAGFLAGICRRKGLIQKDRLSVCVFGGVIMMVVVGPLLDTCSLFTMSSAVTPESAAAIYLSGIPVNIVQNMATVLALLLIEKPMFEKLDRIKIKYGMTED